MGGAEVEASVPDVALCVEGVGACSKHVWKGERNGTQRDETNALASPRLSPPLTTNNHSRTHGGGESAPLRALLTVDQDDGLLERHGVPDFQLAVRAL